MTAQLDKRITHGMSGTRVYGIWEAMKQRCLNKNSHWYYNYGGRGIKICDEWLDFKNFYADMGDDDGLSIERLDSNGNYEPTNCKWATRKEQANNTRSNVLLNLNGEIKNVQQWSEYTGISRACILKRIKLGWAVENILTEPPRSREPKLNYIAKKVINYLFSQGVSQGRLAKAHNVGRYHINKALLEN